MKIQKRKTISISRTENIRIAQKPVHKMSRV
jgi:hypothetical protein